MGRRWFLMGLLLLWFLGAKAQQMDLKHNNSPLKEVIQDIESKTGLLFSFSEAVIENISLSIERSNISLTEVLTLISQRTGLILEQVSPKQIIVRRNTQKTTFCGYLVDALTREPLPYATLVLESGNRGTITDESGFFSMEGLVEDDLLKVSYIGYSDLLIPVDPVGDGGCRTFAMHSDTQSLDEVVVFAYLTQGVNKNADGSFTMIQDEMGLFPGMVEPDIFQSIQFAPGITSLDESASGIQIRGGSPDQNLIFFDGIKMYNTGHFFGMISALNPQVIESAKIFKGGASPEYGDRISGVIDISTGDRVPERTQGGFGLNGTHVDAFLKTPLGEHVGLILSGRRSYTDMLKTPTFDALSQKVFQNTKLVSDLTGQFPVDDDDDDDDFEELLGRDDFLFYDTNAKLIVRPSGDQLITASALYTDNSLDFSVADDEDVIADRYDITNKGAALQWVGGLGKSWEYGVKGYFSDFDSRYENTMSEEDEIEEQMLRHNRVKDLGGDLHLQYRFNPRHKIRLGYQYSETEVHFQLFYDEEVNDDDDDDDFQSRDYNVERNEINRAHSIYTEYTHSFANKGFLSLGARTSHYSTVNDQFVEPRANLEVPISAGIRLKGSFEKRYQPISQLVEFEDTQLRLENNIWTLSDGSDIPVLESTQFSGGFLLDAGGWTLDVDGYHKNISGLTSFTNGFITAPTRFAIGESTIDGVDVLVRRKWDQYSLWAGYTFNEVVYDFAELQANSFPGNNDITHNLELAAAFQGGPWQFSLGWNYRTGSPYTPVMNFDPDSNAISYAAINSGRLPDYHRLDASALYGFKLSHQGFRGEIGASVNNIYAREVPISIFYRLDTNVNTGEVELNQIRQMSQGLTPNMVLRFYF